MNAPLDVSFFERLAKPITSYKKYWASRFGKAPFLPMSRAEMDELGWDSCDIIVVTGDAYVDHPSFGMAIIGRLLEDQGFRVGIIAQPDWQSADPYKALGKPNLFYGVTAGNMDSMINRYTADRKIRTDDAYTPGGVGGKRPDRSVLVYSQRCREAYPDVPIILGGIEGSLRRIAHYDYWQDKVRRSVVIDSKCDLLLYGNAERAIVEIAHRIATKEPIHTITNVRGTAFVCRTTPAGWTEIDSTRVDMPGRVDEHTNPYLMISEQATEQGVSCVKGEESVEHLGIESPQALKSGANAKANLNRTNILQTHELQEPHELHQPQEPQEPQEPKTFKINFVQSAQSELKKKIAKLPKDLTVIRLPSYEQVRSDPVLYAHANRVLHLETNPGNARALVQAHGEGATARDVWLTAPPIPLTTQEMDYVFDLPYARSPHPSYADEQGSHDGPTKIPAWEMIRFSVNIMRGCFGGCTFCSITEHEGRIIQSRSEDSIIREIEDIRDKVKGFTGVVSDLGGPTANMYRIGCKTAQIESACRKPSCVYPGICSNLNTDHGPLIKLYRRARALKGVKKILIGSGLRYDLAVQSPEYVKELVTHHVGGYLKIAPEHTETGPLSKMMKPGMGSYDRFKKMFDQYSLEAGKKQYLVPYFIAAHPGTRDEDMMNLAIWLKKNNFRADQVQTFYPSPMASATAMYHSGRNPLRKISSESETVDVVRGERRRRLHKAFLRWHDAKNWPLLREALKAMGRSDLIGNGRQHLIPSYQPLSTGEYTSARRSNSTPASKSKDSPNHSSTKKPAGQVRAGQLLTQHTGLPPRSLKGSASTPRSGRPIKAPNSPTSLNSPNSPSSPSSPIYSRPRKPKNI